MLRTNLFLGFALFVTSIHALPADPAYAKSSYNLPPLPIDLSWDENGVQIRANGASGNSANVLNLIPSRYLEKIGNDFIRVNLNSLGTPVIVDFSKYYTHNEVEASTVSLVNAGNPRIDIEMPRMLFSNYEQQGGFVLELLNFAGDKKNSRQVFIFKGIDVFFVGTYDCAQRSAKGNSISIDVSRCQDKNLLLKGDLLNLANMDKRVPELCRKYNTRFYTEKHQEAFVCLEDCKPGDPKASVNKLHARKLVTVYGITDYTDDPISFLDDIILTKKGVGLNLKMEPQQGLKISLKKDKKEGEDLSDSYKFFPWNEFFNLTFQKHDGEKQLQIKDAYNNSYLYYSKTHFSNVELIQFFNELKSLIAADLN